MVASSLENFHITRDLDFTIQGMMSRQRRKAQRMEPGDRLVYYITGVQRFGATATVTSKCTENHEPIWKSEGRADDFPWRVNVKADVALEDEQFLDARQIGPRMEYVRRLPWVWSAIWADFFRSISRARWCFHAHFPRIRS